MSLFAEFLVPGLETNPTYTGSIHDTHLGNTWPGIESDHFTFMSNTGHAVDCRKMDPADVFMYRI
jgi:hypothetical protein